jgi:protein Mpv17
MTVTATILLLHVFLLCFFRPGITNAWVASSNAESMTRCRSRYQSVANGCESKSTGSATSLAPTILGARRQRGLLSLCMLKAASKEIERTTFVNNTTITDNARSKVFFDDPSSSSSGLELTSEQKLINLVVLTAAFGYAFYTILSIDSGMTRGWSASEIAMRIPLDNWGAYESYLANKPIMTKSLINVIIYLLGDWLSQTAFKDRNLLEFDLSRTLRNGFIGLCFGPIVHEYYEFSDSILPPELGLLTRLQKILMDQTIYLTVKCGVYISAVGLLNGEDWDTVSTTVKEKLGGIVLTA